jgi:FG-GAP repeat protein
MHFARPSDSPLSLLLPLLIALSLAPHEASGSVPLRLIADPAGENDGDAFGVSVASVGDLNGDGHDDLVIGANYYPTLSGRGRAYVYFGGPAIGSVADLVLPSPFDNIAWFGISVASAGDFNADGWPDFIVGARYAGLPGQAFIFYGGPSLDPTPDLQLIGESTGSSTWFGASVASVGDVNGDGFDDVMVGSPMYRNGVGDVGRAYVYYGGHAPDATPDRMFTGAASGDQLGSVVGSAGDVNGDGFPDVLAVATYNDAGGTDAGAVYVWFGGPAFDTAADLTILGSGANQRILFADGAGDVNGDGYSDLIVSQKDHADVFLGGSAPDAVADVTIGRAFAAVGGAGDVNGDGIDDFVLGDSGDDTGGTDAGKVSVYYGGATLDTAEDESYFGDRPGRYLGRRVGRAGRIDGSDLADVFASAAEDPENVGYDRGRVYLLANSETTDVPTAPIQGVAFVGATPNPAWSDVSLSFSLDHAVPVRVSVYDVAGREVARPISDERLEGRVTRVWRPRGLPSGVYYVSTRMGGREEVRKLIWLGHTR